jgi:beta-lactamase superfamily II metal-dependent hydrolase
MVRLEILPAAHGDAIWIEYGDPKKPRRIVIDGGPATSYEAGLHRRLLLLPPDDRRIDLLVVTHIDTDHIDGPIILLRAAEQLKISVGEIWFNGWTQLNQTQTKDGFKPEQGEFLDALLDVPRYSKKWNVQSKGMPVSVPDEGDLPTWKLHDAQITILSPGMRQIRRLRARWASAMRQFAGDHAEALRRLEARRRYQPPALPPVFGAPGFGNDRSVANGSSIAFLLEYDGVSCLLAADAHPRVLAASLKRLMASRNLGAGDRLKLDAFKLAHHGSMGNVNEELLSMVDCQRWIISTNGDVYDHPDAETAPLVARNCRSVPEFLCNYESPTTLAFADTAKTPRWHTRYPGKGVAAGQAGGIVIDLQPRPTQRSGRVRRRRASSKRPKRT